MSDTYEVAYKWAWIRGYGQEYVIIDKAGRRLTVKRTVEEARAWIDTNRYKP